MKGRIQGVNDFWAMLVGKPVFINEKEYIEYVNEMANYMFFKK